MNTNILNILQHINQKEAIILFFDWLQKLVQELDIKSDMDSFGFTPRVDKKKFSVNLNQRLVFSIYRESDLPSFKMLINETDLEMVETKIKCYSKEEFKVGQPKAFLVFVAFSELLDMEKQEFLLDKWIAACKSYFSPNKSCTYRNSHSNDLYDVVIDKELLTKYLNRINSDMANPQNNDFKVFIEQLKVYIETHYSNMFIFGKTYASDVWVGDNKKIIGHSDAHYEVHKKGNSYSVELHFEKSEGEPDIFYQKIGEQLPEKLEWFSWERKNGWVDTKSIKFKERFPKSESNLVQKLAEQLLYLEVNMGDKVRAILNSNDTNTDTQTNEHKNNNMPKHPLNQILYGPPGTGKTYNTINEALAIIEEKDVQSFENEDRKELTTRYKKYVDAGQIMFTTFHQSMSYEDFIEGIKPETENGQVTYKVKDGIFKLICEKAYTTKNAPNFEEIYQKFVNDKFENNFELKTQFRQYPFDVEVSQNGDCYSISRGEKKTRTGYSKKTIQDYLVNGTKLSYSDPYFYVICDYIKNNYPFDIIDAEAKPHILIIDEINRGNVSQIFGELITLIEDSKRKGELEELEIILPYSKQKFSVPNNLYIIGTMNTADRSVEALDTALRRRFIFKEMISKPELLKECEGVNLQALLTKINERLATLLSKDHTIGHAYFISCSNQKDLETVFYQKIIPLLQEYFYGDLSKIQWIIGEDFVKVEEVRNDIFMRNKENLYNLPKKVSFTTDLKNQAFLDTIKKIYATN